LNSIELDSKKTAVVLPKRKKSINVILKLYVLPIAAVVIFIGIVGFLILPRVFEIFDTLDKISQTNQRYDASLVKLNNLRALNTDSTIVVNQLNAVNSIAPSDQTQVVNFRNKVNDLIVKNNLQALSQIISESNQGSSSVQSQNALSLREVPFQFDIQGTYENILKFFTDLNTLNEFIIVKQMNYSRINTSDLFADSSTEWKLDILLVKYQFNEGSGLDLFYSNVDPTFKIPSTVLEYLTARSLIVEETTTDRPQ
jgi:Tfp pilus assembly protein PilO